MVMSDEVIENQQEENNNTIPDTNEMNTPEAEHDNPAPGGDESASTTMDADAPTDELEEMKKKNNELNDKYLRLYSEFENYRKRTARERIELIGTASAEVVKSMLAVIDDFERAIKANEQAEDMAVVKEGFGLIHHKLHAILTAKGLKEMEAVGMPFDPDLHEALTNIPAPSDDLKGKVVEVIEKGYYLNDTVIRYAKVIVGQ
jgi:molecular chaperone GrpE